MDSIKKSMRAVAPPPEFVDLARSLMVEYGERDGARRLHIGRTAFCRLAAGAPVNAGTLALVRESRRKGAK
jgi:hypothetical protein